jgi:hypothetical protein
MCEEQQYLFQMYHKHKHKRRLGIVCSVTNTLNFPTCFSFYEYYVTWRHKTKCNLISAHMEIMIFLVPVFYKIHKWAKEVSSDLLFSISQKSDNKCGKYRYIFYCTDFHESHTLSMAFYGFFVPNFIQI